MTTTTTARELTRGHRCPSWCQGHDPGSLSDTPEDPESHTSADHRDDIELSRHEDPGGAPSTILAYLRQDPPSTETVVAWALGTGDEWHLTLAETRALVDKLAALLEMEQ